MVNSRKAKRRLLAAVAAVSWTVPAFFPSGQSALGANDPTATVNNGSSNLNASASYTFSSGAALGTTYDVVFAAGTNYSPSAFTMNTAGISVASLNDIDTSLGLSIDDTGSSTPQTLTLNSGTNAVASGNGGATGDLIYVVSGGSLAIGASSTSNLTLTLANSGNIDDAGTLAIGGPVSITAGKTITFTGNGTTTVTGNIANTTGAITVNGTGSVSLGGVNTITGGILISNGTLLLNNANAAQNSIITISAGTGSTGANNALQFNAGLGNATTGGLSGANNEALLDTGGSSIALTIGNNNSTGMSYSGNLSGTGSLTKIGNGAQALTSSNSSYTGATTITGNGILIVTKLADGGLNSSIGNSTNAAGNLRLAVGTNAQGSGTLRYVGNGDSTNRLFTIFSSGNYLATLDASGIGAISFTNTGSVAFGQNHAGTLVLTGNNTDSNSFAPTLNGIGGNPLSLTKNGLGTWYLANAANTYSGVTTIDGGILNVASLANVVNLGSSSIGSGAGNNQYTAATSAVELVFGGGTLQYTGSTARSTDRLFTIGDATGNTAAIDASGTGSGTVNFSNPGSIAFTNATTHTLTLTGNNTGANVLTPVIGDQSVGNATSVAKQGIGAWVLNGINTFTGNTTITSGQLLIGDSAHATASIAGSAVTIQNGGTLAGYGTTGTVNVISGGTLAAADAATTGKLTTGNENWNGGAYQWKIAAPGTGGQTIGSGLSGTAGTSSTWDDVSMSGLNLSAAGGGNQTITISLANTATLSSAYGQYSWVIAQVTGGAPTLPAGVTAASTTLNASTGDLLKAAVTGGANKLFTLDTSSFTMNGLTAPSQSSFFSLELIGTGSGDNLVLDYNATPEPGTATLLLGSAITMLMGRRRRRIRES